MKLVIHPNAGQVLLRVLLTDSSGAPLTGLSASSSGLVVAVLASHASVPTLYAQAASNLQTISTPGTFQEPTAGKCRFGEVSAANVPGIYEIQLPGNPFSGGGSDLSRSWLLQVRGASGLKTLTEEIQTSLIVSDVRAIVTVGNAANLLATLNQLSTLGLVNTDAGNSASQFKTILTETQNDYWVGAVLAFDTSAVNHGLGRRVSAYNGTTKVITVSPAFPSTPADFDVFALIGRIN